MARIFYGDGSVFDDENGNPPARDVQVIIQADDVVGAYALSGHDYYVRQGTEWVGVDIFGLFDYLLDSGLVLFGRTITNDEYRKLLARAEIERTAYKQGERRP